MILTPLAHTARTPYPKLSQFSFTALTLRVPYAISMLTNKDTDTAAAICGSIAEAFYGVPEEIKDIVRTKLDEPLLSVLDAFEERTL